ncbi:MAG: class I SAM-dependent methyltransferase [Sphingomonadales bacterium]|nr:class I SAM-dependent methyltransferase [Sphingomonadales bacterium]
MRGALAAALAALGLLAGCQPAGSDSARAIGAQGFPRADRPPESASGDQLSTEAQRDRLDEATTVMRLADIRPGMTVADLGAGAGYYTMRLAPRVGRKGRVLAEDIDGAALTRLGDRVQRERLDNVSIEQGDEADPHLPPASFDRIFMVHMYHEVSEPYAFLWHLRPALRPGGRVIVVDADRPTAEHGIPPRQLFCELAAVGFRLTEFVRKPELMGYYAQFETFGNRPEPSAIKPCKAIAKS